MLLNTSCVICSIGPITRTVTTKRPAIITSAKSMIRSIKYALALYIPQAALIPFRITPNDTVEAINSKNTLTIPVVVLRSIANSIC